MKRLISALLILTCLIGLFSCSTEAKMPKAGDSRTVLTVGDKKINYDIFRYFYMNAKVSTDRGDNGYWTANPEAEATLKAEVLDMILTCEATLRLASKYKIKLTKQEKKDVNDFAKEWKNTSNGNVNDDFMTEHSFVYLQRYVKIWSKVYNYVIAEENGIIKCDDKTVLADAPVNFRNIRYLMLEFNDTNKEEKRAQAHAILENARQGGDFEQSVKTYCEDPVMKRSPDVGYYFTKGQIALEIEELTETLAVGGISDVVELDGAFFVVERLDVDIEYVENNLSNFIEMYLGRRYNEIIEEIKDGLSVKYTDIWENANTSNVN